MLKNKIKTQILPENSAKTSPNVNTYQYKYDVISGSCGIELFHMRNRSIRYGPKWENIGMTFDCVFFWLEPNGGE